MLIWYRNRFFKEDLRCRRSDERTFTTLGELIQISGIDDPFSLRRRSEPPAVVDNTWRNQEVDPKYLESQRVIMEERRRLEEQQERLRKEEQERLEREYRIRMMEQELERRQVELQRVAIAKEEEIEERRRQLAEFERQREEAERRAAEQRAKEAAELMRLQEEREREKRELEAQQRAAEELIRRERERVEKEAAVLRQQAMMEARRLAAEEAERQRNYILQEQRAREEQLQKQRQQQQLVRYRNEDLTIIITIFSTKHKRSKLRKLLVLLLSPLHLLQKLLHGLPKLQTNLSFILNVHCWRFNWKRRES